MANTLNIYFAGELFDHKHLIGNKLLADAIEQISNQQYQCRLPQEFEPPGERKVDLRDQDLKLLVTSDLGLFSFDGPDLDSGTVVEFIVAKMLDIPSVIVRSDIRAAGDQESSDESWNLMCSNYPRTQVFNFNAIAWYQQALKAHLDTSALIDDLYRKVADEIITRLDIVRAMPSLLEKSQLATIYQWAIDFAGPSFVEAMADTDLNLLIQEKIEKGLYRIS